MNIEELAQRCHANSAKWFPTNHLSQRAAVTHCTLGLVGEAGEVANKVKKLYGYVDQTVPDSLRADIIGELIDTLIYDLVLLDVLGADIPDEVEKVVAKCVARWGAESGIVLGATPPVEGCCADCAHVSHSACLACGMPDARKERVVKKIKPRSVDLTSGTRIRFAKSEVQVIASRKDDGSGWWLTDFSGIADSAFDGNDEWQLA